MAKQTVVNSRLVLRVVSETDPNALKNVSISRIREDATNDALFEAGVALAGLQSQDLGAIHRVDTIQLTEE
jgi:hypothetical protein